MSGIAGRAGREEKARATLTLAGSTMLGALAVAIDYTMKFSGAKELMSAPWAMAFPHLAFLKFDLDGIPIFCSMSFFGLAAGCLTSVILGLAIIARAPSLFGLVGGSMKALAELSTIAGAYAGLRAAKRARWAWTTLGPITRAAVMCLANLVITPTIYQLPLAVVMGLMPFIALFNIIQGAITTYLGLPVALAVVRRAPGILPADAPIMSWAES